MSSMRVIIRATGITAALLAFATVTFAQTRIPIEDRPPIAIGHDVLPPPGPQSTEPPAPYTQPPPKTVNWFQRLIHPKQKMVALAPKASAATPVGVQVMMSDGTVQTYPLGVWLMFQNGQLRAVMPTQYVDQICTLQPDDTWKYTRPGRNVQVWRNGLLQRRNADYTLDQAKGIITPIKYVVIDPMTGQPTSIGWSTDDYVTVAYLY